MTPEQREVLAFVVMDPDAWEAAAIARVGPIIANEHLIAKVARWRPAFLAAKALPNYKTRQERETENIKARDMVELQLAQASKVAKDAKAALETLDPKKASVEDVLTLLQKVL